MYSNNLIKNVIFFIEIVDLIIIIKFKIALCEVNDFFCLSKRNHVLFTITKNDAGKV